jgi:sigma-E factor negative regulatory protein RseC
MATEEGIVIELNKDSARVRATKTGACESCSARSSCHVMGGGNEMEINAINAAGAQVDDRVVLSFDTSSLLKASFLLYIVPIIALMFGAIAGHVLSIPLQLDSSIASFAGAFLFFGLALVFIRSKGNALGKKREYQPRIIRVLKPNPLSSV